MSRDVELAIVGGGPSGVATALFLAAAAPALVPRILILEKERYPREKICAGAVGARADRALAAIGVRVDVPGAPVSGLSIAGEAGALRSLEDRNVGRVVRRVEFDAAFADEARARGIAIVEGARVTALVRERDGVRLSTTAGDVRAAAVVGADGVGSFVRRAIGAPRGRFNAQVVEVDTLAAATDLARAYLHFDVTDPTLPGYAWDFPTVVGGRQLVCRGIYELRDDETPAPNDSGVDVGERLRARLATQGVEPVGKIKRFAERGLALHEPTSVPRVLLVGEAAGIDPVLGEGIAQAILYGAAAGPYLATRIERRELSFCDWGNVLRSSRVGLDLRIRSALAPFAYGARRPTMDRWVTSSHGLARAGLRYFAGERVPRLALARAALDLARAAIPSAIPE